MSILLDNKYKIEISIFIFFTFLLVIESFFHFYSSKLSYFCFQDLKFSLLCNGQYTQQVYDFFDLYKTGYNPIIWNENGIIETIQIIFLLLTIFNILKILPSVKKIIINQFFYFFLCFYLILILYYFFEEISWGQHYFKWSSTNYFLEHNNQKETNFHNISNLLDQLPRTLLTVWCALPFLIFKVFSKFNFNKMFLNFVYPSSQLRIISYILLIFLLPNLIVGSLVGELDNNSTISINSTDIFNFITLNFIRLSEFQELIFTIYLYYHIIFFKKLILSKI